MEMTNQQKLKVYKDHLNNFENLIIKNIVEQVIINTPTIFFGASTSSSGKYHPSATNGIMGLVKHSVAVMLIAKDLMSNETIMNVFNLQDLSKDDKEIILAACLLHDNAKYGLDCDIYSKEKLSTKQNHPRLVYDIVKKSKLLGVNQEQDVMVMKILDLIGSHMGPWNLVKDDKDLPKPSTSQQSFVHMCDYIASRKTFDIVSELSLPDDISPKILECFNIQNQ